MRRALAAALAGCMAWLYADLGKGLVVQWVTSPEASYGLIVVAVALMVLWERRRHLIVSAANSQASWAGAGVVAVGLGAYLAGMFAADLFTARVSFVIVAGGLLWLLAGTRAAASAFVPLLFLIIAIPLPELIVTGLTGS